MIALDARGASLGAVAAVALFVFLARPRAVVRADDTIEMLATVELRIEDPAGERVVRAPVPIFIGRAPNATVVLADGLVSRLHARIDVWDGGVAVRDLGSRNGTWLNARPIEGPVRLVAGDELDVGATRIVFEGLRPLVSA